MMPKAVTNRSINLVQLDSELGTYGLCADFNDPITKIICTADESPVTQKQLEDAIALHVAAPEKQPTIDEKLASVGLSLNDLRAALGLSQTTTLDANHDWQPPTPMPSVGGPWVWDEDTLSWVKVTVQVAKRSGVGTVFSNREGVQLMTAEEALAALDRGDPIHVQGEEMRRFIATVFTPQQRRVWEVSHNSHLGCTPREALAAGRVADVEEAARAFDAGTYA